MWLLAQFSHPTLFVKAHFVEDALLEDVRLDLERGDGSVGVAKTQPVGPGHECPEVFLDEPGMIAVDRPYEDFVMWDGLPISIPSEDLRTMLVRLREQAIRPGGFLKLHGWMHCLVLTAAQRDELAKMFADRLPIAEGRAHAFYADRKPMSQLLQEANARAHGKELDAYHGVDCGAHRTDRFHLDPKKGGAA